MRRQRGSAYLFVVVCAAVMGLVLASLIPLVGQCRTTQNRRNLAARVDQTVSGLAEAVTSQALYSTVLVGSSQTLTLNGVTATATVSDGSAVVPNSFLLSGTATAGDQTFAISRYVTQGSSSTPFSYALYSATDTTYAGAIVTGANGQDGNVFFNGKANLGSASTVINGNLSASKNVSVATGARVTGSIFANASAVAMPSVSWLNYYNAAAYRASGTTTTTSGFDFPNNALGTQFTIYYVSGDTYVSGQFSGHGTGFIQGNLYVTGDTTYASSGDEIALVVNGNVTIQSGCSQMIGYIFATGSVTIQSPSVRFTRGSLVANSIVNGSGTLQITRDPYIINNATAATNLNLPGFWP